MPAEVRHRANSVRLRRYRCAISPSLAALRRQPIFGIYGTLGLLVAGYLLVLIVRPVDQSMPLLDNWGVAIFEVTVAALGLLNLRRRRSHRAFALALGLALLAWGLGDLMLAAESLNGSAPAPPTWADASYLGFYPLAYAAIVLLLREEVTEFLPANWLDGAIAGLGAAGLCGAFAFTDILHGLGGAPLSVATDLAYPLGDVVLFGLAAGGSAVLAEHRPRWFLLALACAINAVGDTFNLFDAAGKTTHIGLVLDGIAWPAAILLMSVVIWLPSSRGMSAKHSVAPSFLLPMLGAAASLVILVIGSIHHVIQVTIALAALTLLLVGVRLALSIRTLRILSDQRRRLANTDHLTSLGNRRQLDQALDTYFATRSEQRPDHRLAFLFIDLDHFKEVNDFFGHAAGDEVLRQIGPRLKACLRSSDLLVRLGGDELGVLLFETDPDYCTTVAQRVLSTLREPFDLGEVIVRISASIGIAIAPTDASDSAGLMRCADLAMYRAKESKSAIELYRDLDGATQQIALVKELATAVAEHRLQLFFQPQINLAAASVVACEALLRWPHPSLGMVPPLTFLPLAEEAGLMEPLTGFVVEQALAQLSSWRAAGHAVRAAINVSTTNLLEPGFADFLSGRLEHYALPAELLVVEITETTVLREFERSKRMIADLHGRGVQVSMDDFGAGFTSLAYLVDLELTEIKLDRAFISGLAGAERRRELVGSTIRLCHSLGLRVVAEGIEDAATLEALRSLGCDLGQGYHIGRPMPAPELSLMRMSLGDHRLRAA